ncbi:CPBP family intramembrane glutamic endopeptidase [Clostridium estertheticum]|uniref:CPBP family intramembrane glutamic endopeptidase n=1 Tax=Clostridium estertheticum TaxID=238834 RepID=UPI001C7D9D60|nr:CPBP family intramembrane metalloprotease [Clostridium estertheticum]
MQFLQLYKVNFKIIPSIIILSVCISFFNEGFGTLLIQCFRNSTFSHIPICFSSIIHIVFLAPICEEIFFRGIIFTKCKYIMPSFIAILIQAFIFGICHGALSGNIIQAILAIISAIIFALIYNYTNNLTISILLHIFMNLLQIMVNLLPFAITIYPILYIILAILCLFLFLYLLKYKNIKIYYCCKSSK